MTHQIFPSILDNDLYKFTMQNAVFTYYKRDIPVVYQFTNREKQLQLNAEAVDWLQKQIDDLENLHLTDAEREYLSGYPYFQQDYIDFLYQFRYKPKEQVKLKFDKTTNDLELEVVGNWHETILYEVPLLALISEAYFRFVDRDWNYDGQYEHAAEKARVLLEHGCAFAEFGTRRRRDFKTQDTVIRALKETFETYKTNCLQEGKEVKGLLTGTSNVYFAMKYAMNAIGTVAHEFFMAVSALENVKHANRETLDIWHKVYKGALGIALTDTFTTPIFLKDFQYDLASVYTGVRHDSGDPMQFTEIIVNHYKSIGIDPSTKTIVFSDSLNVERAIALYDHAKKLGIKSSFGIGTSLTNDFKKASDGKTKSKPLNIVIKIKECIGKRVIKLSDDVLKHSADEATISAFEHELGITK
ncbi:Putative Nicotinate phosphoribosyltransferase [Rhizopus microsporus]|nr:Putative Nicotinate phosphoribosyltransferase [Rhizopus microsporus]